MVMATLIVFLGTLLATGMMLFAFYNPAELAVVSRRVRAIRSRNIDETQSVERELRKIVLPSTVTAGRLAAQIVPNAQALTQRLNRTGKGWTLNSYALWSVGLATSSFLSSLILGASLPMALISATASGLVQPYLVVSALIRRRSAQFIKRFPEALELMVRGLRSGLPISKTFEIVASEFNGPVAVEYQSISDMMRIGRTMDAALQHTADRLDIQEFRFFCISIAIQRETGGNLAETLANLADVLRKRAQMKLKIKAMSSEAKASGAIIGLLPFLVFLAIYSVNPKYMLTFFTDIRLIYIGCGALIWMALGGFVMAKMANFDI